MNAYTQVMLDELVKVRKKIIEPPRKAMQILQGSHRDNMRVAAADGREFAVFMRISEKFEEDFSIGLRYEPPADNAIILLRCNGPHGEVRNGISDHPHFGYHIHRATVESIRLGKRPEAGAEMTAEFASYRQALRFFLKEANISWTQAEFPSLDDQKELF